MRGDEESETPKDESQDEERGLPVVGEGSGCERDGEKEKETRTLSDGLSRAAALLCTQLMSHRGAHGSFRQGMNEAVFTSEVMSAIANDKASQLTKAFLLEQCLIPPRDRRKRAVMLWDFFQEI